MNKLINNSLIMVLYLIKIDHFVKLIFIYHYKEIS